MQMINILLQFLLFYLHLREAIFSPEMIWEDVPQCRCSKSERVFTVPCILHIDAGWGPGGNASLGSIPQVRTSRYGKKTFIFAALWNSLPDHFRTENR
jgi:hypothetical protein